MIVLVMGDNHGQGKNPIARKDDYVKTQFKKLNEVINIANTHNTPIISVGDLFNSAVIANSIQNKFGELFLKLTHPLYFVWGNHDLMYHSIKLWKRTSLGTLLCNNPKVRHISEFHQDYGIKWDWMDWNCPIQKTGAKYLLAHEAIVNKKILSPTSALAKDETFSIQITDKSLREYKTIICGHWHNQYTINHNGIKVINPGPVMRQTAADYRIPSVGLLNLETGFCKRIMLQSALPTNQVIQTKHLDSKIDTTHSVKEFIKAIQTKGISDQTSFIKIISKILDINNLDEDLEDLLRDIISVALERNSK